MNIARVDTRNIDPKKQCKYCVSAFIEKGKLRCKRGLKVEYVGVPWYCFRDFERAIGADDDR